MTLKHISKTFWKTLFGDFFTVSFYKMPLIGKNTNATINIAIRIYSNKLLEEYYSNYLYVVLKFPSISNFPNFKCYKSTISRICENMLSKLRKHFLYQTGYNYYFCDHCCVSKLREETMFYVLTENMYTSFSLRQFMTFSIL